ncbi:hypothetical protein [Spirosoma fluminis]
MHDCIHCQSDCYCSGDIDDIYMGDEPNCTGCDECREADLDDSDDDEFDDIEVSDASTCRQCGCHTFMACNHPDHGPCWWVEQAIIDAEGAILKGPLCSHCLMEKQKAVEPNSVDRPWKEVSHE